MRNLFYQVIEEAVRGEVLIDEEIWPIAFNTIIYDKNNIKLYNYSDRNLSTLIIKDENKFFEMLDKYIELELKKARKYPHFFSDEDNNHKKFLMAYLFTNATTEDFINPVNFLRRNIAFLIDNTFSYLNDGIRINLGENFFHSDLLIKNTTQSVFMETPNKIEFAFVKEKNEEQLKYNLPIISYGICTNSNGEKECYIYSVLNPKSKEQNVEQIKYGKKISRLLYKINNDVLKEESQEYIDYKNGNSNYYPENISDVSPSAVISLITFISLLKNQEIYNIKGIPYLPIRYLSRDLTAKDYDAEKRKALEERNNFIQNNITQKFIRTFRRVSYHINGMDIVSYPYEFDEFINIRLNAQMENVNNDFLEDIVTSITEKTK